jgi:hypothetical protein
LLQLLAKTFHTFSHSLGRALPFGDDQAGVRRNFSTDVGLGTYTGRSNVDGPTTAMADDPSADSSDEGPLSGLSRRSDVRARARANDRRWPHSAFRDRLMSTHSGRWTGDCVNGSFRGTTVVRMPAPRRG